MKTLKYLTICFVVCCLFSSSVCAVCDGIALDDRLTPSGKVFQVDDIVDYTVSLEITGSLDCPIKDIEVRFWAPDNPPVNTQDVCNVADPNGVVIFQSVPGETLEFGDPPIVITSAEASVLSYKVSKDDVDGDNKFRGYICTTYVAITDGGDEGAKDEKPSVNTLLEPKVCVTKVANCDKVLGDGTKEVTYTITIENCGDTDLELVSIYDILLGNLTDAVADCNYLVPDANCVLEVTWPVAVDDTSPIVNIVDVNYLVVGSDITVSDFAQENVTIVNPSFTVDKVCESPNDYVLVGSDANFIVTVENDGDVTLDFTSSELGSFTLVKNEKKVEVVSVKATPDDCANGVENQVSVTGKYVGGKDDCLEWEDTVQSTPVAVCNVACPEFEVIKTCDGPVDFANDPNAYFTITVRNLGNVPLDFMWTDPNAGIDDPQAFSLDADGEAVVNVVVPVTVCGAPVGNEVSVLGYYIAEQVWGEIQTAGDDCPCDEQGEEGCTPGYWKNSTGCWCEAYEPDDLVGDVWVIPACVDELADDELLDALKYKGGSGTIGAARNLLRHATAALLNACNDEVVYPRTVDDIIEDVETALATCDRRAITSLKNDLAFDNELGCPIANDNAPEGIRCERND